MSLFRPPHPFPRVKPERALFLPSPTTLPRADTLPVRNTTTLTPVTCDCPTQTHQTALRNNGTPPPRPPPPPTTHEHHNTPQTHNPLHHHLPPPPHPPCPFSFALLSAAFARASSFATRPPASSLSTTVITLPHPRHPPLRIPERSSPYLLFRPSSLTQSGHVYLSGS